MANVRALRVQPKPTPSALAVAVIGVGNVGSALVRQLHAARRLKSASPQLVAICNSSQMLLHRLSTPHIGESWQADLVNGEKVNLEALTAYLERQPGPVAIVDATASQNIAARHKDWLRRGIHVVTANKLACSSPWSDYQQLRQAAQTGARYHYETTVGAGLPILGVLRDFVETGDEILRVEGILSGTLSRLAIALERGADFDSTLRQLQQDGYTEPDPAIDLAGTDVARKLIILARVAGVPMDIEQVETRAFGNDVSELRRQFATAAYAGKVLRYVARLERRVAVIHAQVGLAEYAREHVFAQAKAGDNMIQITTQRYLDNPLIIQGPGAGREVTAAGIFADLLKI